MMNDAAARKPRLVVIVGPTAGGKSEFAVELAERIDGQIVNADSMQVYRHMDAGTAKPSAELRRRVPHHLIDIVEPTEPFTVADWVGLAEPLIETIQAAGRHPIVVGGTNLYLKALLEGMFEGPPADPAFRATLAHVPPQELHQRLATVDPIAAERIHPNDRKRLVRALEVFALTGQPISQWQSQWTDAEHPEPATTYRHDPILLGLDWPTLEINRRINARVKAMFDPAACGLAQGESLPSEVHRLESAGLLGIQARQALGYKQVIEHIAVRCTLDEAFEETKIATRRFAKSQRTWLKRYRGVYWLPAAEKTPAELGITAASIVTID